jgi:DNA-binding NarL/FixJ family response regulator
MRSSNPRPDLWLIEGHPLAARYLQHLLGSTGVATLTRGRDLPDEPGARSGQTVFVVDATAFSMPLAKTLRLLSANFPQAEPLVIGERLSKEELCRAVLLGARGFVPYEEIESKLARALERVRDRHLWMPGGVLEEFAALAAARQKRKGRTGGPFTAREIQILGLLERRLSNKEIGSAVGIAERTVKFHLQNLFPKLGAHNRSSAVELARGIGLLGAKPAPTSSVCAGAVASSRTATPRGGAK